jgi:hypothetical protein
MLPLCIYKYKLVFMKVIISKTQYQRLMEAGSNSVAMDLDIYTQPMQTDTDNGNLDVIDASEQVIDSLEELISMFKGGKKTRPEVKDLIYKGLDGIKKAHSEIKYEK